MNPESYINLNDVLYCHWVSLGSAGEPQLVLLVTLLDLETNRWTLQLENGPFDVPLAVRCPVLVVGC